MKTNEVTLELIMTTLNLLTDKVDAQGKRMDGLETRMEKGFADVTEKVNAYTDKRCEEVIKKVNAYTDKRYEEVIQKVNINTDEKILELEIILNNTFDKLEHRLIAVESR